MTLMEDRLREGLHGLADDAAPDQPALRTLIDCGEALRRRRHIRQAVGGLAVATLVALTGWMVLSPHPITLQPAPLATPSTTQPTAQAFFGFNAGEPATYHLVTASTVRNGDRVALTVIDEIVGGATQTFQYDAAAGAYFSVAVHDHLSVTIIPTVATGVIDTDRGGSLSMRPIPSAGLTLCASWWDGVIARADAGLIWQTQDGVLQNNLSRVVPSSVLAVPGFGFRVFSDPDLHSWGVFSSNNTVYASQWANPDRSEVRLLSADPGRSSIGTLPAGATRVAISPVKTGTDWTTVQGPDGAVWWLVHERETPTSDSSTKRLVRSISYTDSSGKRVTFTPKLTG